MIRFIAISSLKFLTAVYISTSALCLVGAFHLHKFPSKAFHATKTIQGISDGAGAPSLSPAYESSTSDEVAELRKWYFLNNNKRPDVYIEDASSIPQLISEVLKAVLISFRVLEKDKDMRDHTILMAFPNLYDASADKVLVIKDALSQIERNMNVSSALFQPNLARIIDLHIPKLSSSYSSSLLVSIQTFRTISPDVQLSDFDEYTPSVEEIITNDIPDFPFPTIYDFISEINRPPDPITIANMRFKFSIKGNHQFLFK
jgi:hypothetical protein